jgi:hypothetical protein
MSRRRTVSPVKPVRLEARDDRGNAPRLHVEDAPTWTDIKAAIERLDGKSFNEVTLHNLEPPRKLTISGGGEALQCAIQCEDGDDLRVAHSDRANALRAARYFFDKRAEDPKLAWSER